MIGIGAANVAAGFFQGFAVSTSGSRTAVAEQSGAKSQLTGVVGAGLVVVLLLFLNSLLADLPQSALAGVVIAAALSLTNLAALRKYARRAAVVAAAVAGGDARRGAARRARRHRRRDLPCRAAVLPAQLVAARRGARPHRRQRGLAQRRRPRRRAGGPGHRGVPVGGAALLRQRRASSASRSVGCVQERRPRWIVLQCEAITDIDVTAAEMLEQLDLELNRDGIHLAFVEMRSRLQDLVGRHGLYDTLDRDHFYDTIDAALAAIDQEDSGTGPAG